MRDITDEITLELAYLQRTAHERVRQRNAEQQLGLAWVDLPMGSLDTAQSTVVPTSTPAF